MVPTDKFLHFWISFGIGFVAPGLAMLAGAGKEVYDALTGGDASAGDLAADGLGIFFALIASPFR